MRPLQTARPAPDSGLAIAPEAVLRGQLVHGLLQALSAPGGADRERLPAKLAQQLGAAIAPSLYAAALAEADAVLAAPALQAHFAPGLRAWNEVSLPVLSEDGIQMNVLDRLVDDGERLWVLDYKTHRAGNATSVLEGAREQLLRYVAAVRRLWPDRLVLAGVIWTPRAQWLPLEISA